MKKMMVKLMVKANEMTIRLKEDRTGSLTTEQLVMVIGAVVIGGLIIGILANRVVPDFTNLLVEKVKGLFNL